MTARNDMTLPFDLERVLRKLSIRSKTMHFYLHCSDGWTCGEVSLSAQTSVLFACWLERLTIPNHHAEVARIETNPHTQILVNTESETCTECQVLETVRAKMYYGIGLIPVATMDFNRLDTTSLGRRVLSFNYVLNYEHSNEQHLSHSTRV